MLTDEQKQRFARQLALPEIGEAGQERLLAARVLVVGAGGLGSPAAYYLAAAGIGTLGIMDADTVDLSNLQRQILHATADVGRAKVESAAAKLTALAPICRVMAIRARLTPENAAGILRDYEFVIDATDNFASKFLIADVCHAAGKPYSHAGIGEFAGQAMTVLPGTTACYRCVFDAPPPESNHPARGPLGAVPGVIGAIQAAEAIKQILGIGTLLTNRLFVFDLLAMDARTIPVQRNPHCRLCGT
jgi:molybdopterin/thiamine biosynthesis adenylyltransferase